MPICHDKKFIFFHIPRCAGTSFTNYFQFSGYGNLYGIRRFDDEVVTLHHLTATDMVRRELIDNDILQSYFKFTVIRDPFERMASDFLWHKIWDKYEEFGDMSFPDFLGRAECIIREERYFERRHYDHFRPMADYCIQDGQLIVDDILLLEDIHNELLRIRSTIGTVNLPHKNSNSYYEDLRTTKNIDSVYKLYACDKALHDNVASLR